MERSRRQFLRAGFALGGIAAAGDAARLFERLAAQTICPSAGPPGELLGVVPFSGMRGPRPPYGEMVGGPGLDARLFTDLSDLDTDRLITPTDRVFVRTAAPPSVAHRAASWTVEVDGLAARASIPLAELKAAAGPMGPHLIECSGNTDPRNFGLMSVAEWDGVSLAGVVSRSRPGAKATAVRVSGVDHDTQSSPRSIPGASWIFPLDALNRLGPFLATGMNSGPLPPDHGAPLRLVVPGWYGCAWIKWVNEIHLVGGNEPATSQMREFAARTHQQGVPELARDYAPPAIDLAATPIRIEKRRVDGRLQYRIIGIVWGGDRTIDRLQIRFSAGGAFTPFEICPPPRTHRMWSLWEYRWRPEHPGLYDIALKAADPGVRTRRLDVFFYVRRVLVDEV